MTCMAASSALAAPPSTPTSRTRYSGSPTSWLPSSAATIDEHLVHTLPQLNGYGCAAIGIVPVDVARGLPNPIPAD